MRDIRRHRLGVPLALLVGAVVAAVALGAGCGPIEYVNQVSRRADSAVEAARAVQADKYSPYYWTRATQYLHKAREEAAYADFQSANRFGRLAEEAAEKAREESVRRAGNPEGMQELGPLPDQGGADSAGGLAPLGGDEADGADRDKADKPRKPTDDGADETPPGLGGKP